MKQLLRILVALGALGVLTGYFFSDLVLIEPTPREVGADSSGTSPSTVPVRQDPIVSDQALNSLIEGGVPKSGGLPGNSGISFAPGFRGITGSSSGAISAFKEKWQSLYSRWPMGKKFSRKGGQPISGDSILLHARIGNLLTLISLVVALSAISLAISLVEEKARA